MSHRAGRLQQENAKLREEIKKLKGALKDVNQDSSEELPLKAFKEKSPISKDRKKELRDEIDNRLNYMMPSQEVVKARTREVKLEGNEKWELNEKEKEIEKEKNEIEVRRLETREIVRERSQAFVGLAKGREDVVEDSEEMMVASFGHDEEKHVGMPKQVLKDMKGESLEATEQSSKVECFGEIVSPRSIGTLEDDYLKVQSSLERSEDSPEFSARSPEALKTIDPRVLKDSFSSFYNDESLNKTLQEKSFNESLINPPVINQTQPIDQSSGLLKNPKSKYPESILKSSSSLKSMPSSQSYPEKTLLNEIEALRLENMKLRLQLTKNSKSSLGSAGTLTRNRSRNKAEIRNKSKSVSKSKSPARKCKSRSITPRDLSTRRLRRNVSNNTLVGDSSLTPRRSRHCKTCDHLLSKGYSTKYCGKHGNAKLA